MQKQPMTRRFFASARISAVSLVLLLCGWLVRGLDKFSSKCPANPLQTAPNSDSMNISDLFNEDLLWQALCVGLYLVASILEDFDAGLVDAFQQKHFDFARFV